MNSSQCKPKYSGSALPGNAEVVVLFDSTVAFPFKNAPALASLRKLYLNLTNSQAGTLKLYASVDRGANWIQVIADDAISAVTTESTKKDYLIEAFEDFKLTWTNGATPQTVFRVDMLLGDDRAAYA